ncbi:MAG: hypothetical protein WC595_03850 [Candidatus Nanoarchaeia archaeon]
MSVTLLKYNIELLGDVVKKYDSLGEEEKRKALPLKNQILFLLTAVKKEIGKEKNGSG